MNLDIIICLAVGLLVGGLAGRTITYNEGKKELCRAKIAHTEELIRRTKNHCVDLDVANNVIMNLRNDEEIYVHMIDDLVRWLVEKGVSEVESGTHLKKFMEDKGLSFSQSRAGR